MLVLQLEGAAGRTVWLPGGSILLPRLKLLLFREGKREAFVHHAFVERDVDDFRTLLLANAGPVNACEPTKHARITAPLAA